MRNGNLLKSRVSEIRVKRIRVNQGVGVVYFLVYSYTDLVSLLLALIANRMIAQMATHMIKRHHWSCHLIHCNSKEIGAKAALLFKLTQLIKP